MTTPPSAPERTITLRAIRSHNLDTQCYRGSAPLADLARVSKADVFDQDQNSKGLQRNLSPSHAQAAYEYAAMEANPDWPRAFPEVVLNVRDKTAVKIVEAGDGWIDMIFDCDRLRDAPKVIVSRIDGNHRLEYTAGGTKRHTPLQIEAPFQIHVGLRPDQEAKLFLDINANQKGLNTSHLSWLRSRLTEEEEEIRQHPERWVAKRLADDPMSPWSGLIHKGGSKAGARAQGYTRPVNFKSLENGVKRTLGKSQYIHDLTDIKAQYVVIRNYWNAVKQVFSQEWATPQEYQVLKNVGVMSFSILGGTVIDRCLASSPPRVSTDPMTQYLQQCAGTWDWASEAVGEKAIAGMSGNRAIAIIAGAMAGDLSDDFGPSMLVLQENLARQAGIE